MPPICAKLSAYPAPDLRVADRLGRCRILLDNTEHHVRGELDWQDDRVRAENAPIYYEKLSVNLERSHPRKDVFDGVSYRSGHIAFYVR